MYATLLMIMLMMLPVGRCHVTAPPPCYAEARYYADAMAR